MTLSSRHRIVLGTLVVLLLAAVAAYVATGGDGPAVAVRPKRAGVSAQPPVDLRPLQTAEALAPLATTPEERDLARQALRLGDHAVDLAFAIALQEAANRPVPSTPETIRLNTRIQRIEQRADSEQRRVTRLTRDSAKGTEAARDTRAQELQVVKAMLGLHQDELEGLKDDLLRAGGDPQAQIQQLAEEHDAGDHADSTGGPLTPAAASAAAAAAPAPTRGVIGRLQEWYGLRSKRDRLQQARQEALDANARLGQQRDTVQRRVDAERAASKAGTADSSGRTRAAVTAATLVADTKRLADGRREVGGLRRRMRDEAALADVYARWDGVVATQQRSILHRALLGVIAILGIAVWVALVTLWLDRFFAALTPERKRLLTVRAVAKFAVQGVGVVLAALVLIGPPSQLATVVGLAGAGLTVALKDFIVGFFGWFALMGRNGIRLGDWVEINGVSGEVVEITLFHTVLLETGNWTDAGHPTGRRVTFTNSFAIEGHYFNFSTSGQWLWDEVQVVLPSGQDPNPTIEAIRAMVLAETADNARDAEVEWQRATDTRGLRGFTAAPAIEVRPGAGGVQVHVRYITRAQERYQLRTRLYQSIVGLLGRPAVAGS